MYKTLKIYLSGINSRSELLNVKPAIDAHNKILLSYWYVKRWFHKFDMSMYDVLLDSSAFKVLGGSGSVTLSEYIGFIKATNIQNYVNLDVIGDPINSERNLMIMQDSGLTPIPVYHWGQNLDILYDLSEKYRYIGIGGTVPTPARSKVKLAREINHILNTIPNLPKVHMFGYTSFQGLYELKDTVYSTDSSTWLHRACHREHILDDGKRIKYDINPEPPKYKYQIAMDNIRVFTRLEDRLNEK